MTVVRQDALRSASILMQKTFAHPVEFWVIGKRLRTAYYLDIKLHQPTSDDADDEGCKEHIGPALFILKIVTG